MHFMYEHWLWFWDWLTKQGAARATVILVFVTCYYAYLTSKMTRAMGRQTRAQVQPVISASVDVAKEEFYPKGRFELKNLGAQPLVILDMRLEGRLDGIILSDGYRMYEQHILPPHEMIAFTFDFTKRYTEKGVSVWSPGNTSFNLTAVVSDLSEDVILTYQAYSYWNTLTVEQGIPLKVRWKFFWTPIEQRYNRLRLMFNPTIFDVEHKDTRSHKTRTKTRLRGKTISPYIGPPGEQ